MSNLRIVPEAAGYFSGVNAFVIAAAPFPRWHGNGSKLGCFSVSCINLFPQFRAKSPETVALPATEPPGLPPGEQEAKPANMVIPIQVNNVDYALLMRALCPTGTHVPEDIPADVPEPKALSAGDGAGQPPPVNLRVVAPDRPSGTPIV
jgi:hypothetical protein